MGLWCVIARPFHSPSSLLAVPPTSITTRNHLSLSLCRKMSAIIQTLKSRSFLPARPLNDSLPVSETDSKEQTLRRRLSSLSLKLPPVSSSVTSSWSFRRSKSVSSMGEDSGSSLRKWWDWGWSWILSRKPVFAKDLEMNEDEARALGSQTRGSWKHVFFKVRSQLKKLVSSDSGRLPQTFKYDSDNYAKNFDDGSVRS